MVAGLSTAEVTFSDPESTDELWMLVSNDNDPSGIVGDYTSRETPSGALFDQTIVEWSDKWEGRPTPQEGCPMYFLAFTILESKLQVPAKIMRATKEALILP